VHGEAGARTRHRGEGRHVATAARGGPPAGGPPTTVLDTGALAPTARAIDEPIYASLYDDRGGFLYSWGQAP